MITFVMAESHFYTIATVLETRSHPRHGGIILLTWRDFLQMPRLPASDYVFVDLERQPPEILTAAKDRLAQLRAKVPELKALNAPDTRLGRLDVMRRLHQPAMNRFRVVAADDLPPDLTFPVFLRRLDDHEGPTSALLPDHDALDGAIGAMIAKGAPRDALAVTEYVDARNEDGLHEKRSYFRIGDRFDPSALDTSRNWICKGVAGDVDGVPSLDREREFLAGNEDLEIMRLAFNAAGITYGRADYAVVGGRPQVFEINTNPMIDRPEALPAHMQHYARTALSRWMEALEEFSPAVAGEAPRWITVGGITSVPNEASGHFVRRSVRALLSRTGRLHRETTVMRRLRAVRIMR